MKEKKPINIEIGQRIKQSREAAGMTQEAFSELIGLGPKHVSAIERGAVGVSIATLQRICKVLSISSDTLIFGGVEKNSVGELTARLELLSPEQYKIASDIVYKLLEAFALGEDKNRD